MKIDKSSFERRDNILTNINPILSVSDYILHIDWLKREFSQCPHSSSIQWFRGVSEEGYALEPRINRNGDWNYAIEQNIVAEFVRKAKILSNGKIKLVWDWYHLMQHYGTPTRLLDWTEGSLIALYFAVREPKKEKKPAVWIIDPIWLNYISHSKKDIINTATNKDDLESYEISYSYLQEFKDIPELPAAIYPQHIDIRIQVQKSCFTIHGKNQKGFQEIANIKSNPNIAKLVIESLDNPIKIKRALSGMGISESTLFPDMEGISRELQEEYHK